MAEFALPRSAHFAAEHICHQLHAVADAEDRRAELEYLRSALRRTSVSHTLRPA
jgi:hypothetical protein